MDQFQERVFLGFVVIATVAMAWIASPFYGAILWALTAAIVFAPANAALAKALNGHRNTAAGLTLHRAGKPMAQANRTERVLMRNLFILKEAAGGGVVVTQVLVTLNVVLE